MSEVLIYRLAKNREAILKDLEADQVLDYLYQEDVLDSDSYEEVRDETRREKQAELLLSHVERKSEAIEKMIQALKRSSQRHLAMMLQAELDNEATLSIGISKSFPTASDLIYPMTRVPCGYAVIINNSLFDDMDVREGSEVDVRSMNDLFEYLQFKVAIYKNQTADGMKHIVRHYSRKVDHTEFDCFVLFLMSHGFDRGVYGTDGKKVYLQEDIRNLFTAETCYSLADKPKLFFVQACRGTEASQGYLMNDSPSLPGATPSQESSNYTTYTPANLDATLNYFPPNFDKEYIPNDADIYVHYASTSNYAAHRSTHTGGWFVTHLNKVFHDCAKTEDLQSMMLQVTQKVSNEKSPIHVNNDKTREYSMQCPQSECNLRKKVFFNPKKTNF